MLMHTVLTQPINFLVFDTLSPFLNRKQLAAYTGASMGALLIFLVTFAPHPMSSVSYTLPSAIELRFLWDSHIVAELPVLVPLLKRRPLQRGWSDPFSWVLSFFTTAPSTPLPDPAAVLRLELTKRCHAEFKQGVLTPSVYEELLQQIETDYFSSSFRYTTYTAEYHNAARAFKLILKKCPPELGFHKFYSQTAAWDYFLLQKTRFNTQYNFVDRTTLSYLIKERYSQTFDEAVKKALCVWDMPAVVCENWVIFFTFIFIISVLVFLWWLKRYWVPLGILGSEAIRLYWKVVQIKQDFFDNPPKTMNCGPIEYTIMLIGIMLALIICTGR